MANQALINNWGVRACLNHHFDARYLMPDHRDIDAILVGLSSFENQQEINLLQHAQSLEIPTFVLEDTHGSCMRPGAKGQVKQTTAIVASHLEIKLAKQFGYQDAVYLGGPPLWQSFWHIQPVDIKRHASEIIVLVGGIKDAVITNTLLRRVIHAMSQIGKKWRLIFKPHPNETTTTQASQHRYLLLGKVTLIESPAPTDSYIPVADICIFTSGATGTITAAYQRKPVIYYEDSSILKRMQQQSGNPHTPHWYPAEMGACLKATPKTMRQIIESLLTDQGRDALRQRQVEVYPKFSDQLLNVEKRILDYIQD